MIIQRFHVGNSGVKFLVEGIRDHGCMSSGIVIILGKCGRNFATSMSGEIAYILNVDEYLIQDGILNQ
jgi:glutamate synthase (NADPH) large chain